MKKALRERLAILIDMGFANPRVVQNKHCKVTVTHVKSGQDMVFVIPATPSDQRGLHNMRNDVTKQLRLRGLL